MSDEYGLKRRLVRRFDRSSYPPPLEVSFILKYFPRQRRIMHAPLLDQYCHCEQLWILLAVLRFYIFPGFFTHYVRPPAIRPQVPITEFCFLPRLKYERTSRSHMFLLYPTLLLLPFLTLQLMRPNSPLYNLS